MAVLTSIARRTAEVPEATLESNRAEDERLMQRINAAAAKLHRLWSRDSALEPEQWAERRATAAALQAEIDGFYERRRQLVAERMLLRDTPASRRRAVWARPDSAAA